VRFTRGRGPLSSVLQASDSISHLSDGLLFSIRQLQKDRLWYETTAIDKQVFLEELTQTQLALR
jgi:hypothetical protein